MGAAGSDPGGGDSHDAIKPIAVCVAAKPRGVVSNRGINSQEKNIVLTIRKRDTGPLPLMRKGSLLTRRKL